MISSHCCYISAKINLATSHMTTVCTVIIYIALLLRIVFGPFPLYGVVAFHYSLRVANVSFIIMLTFNRIISALFIIDFDRMAAMPDRHVIIYLGAVTFIFTLAHVVQEAVIRRLRGLDHFARMSIFEYLGKVVRMK